MATFDIRLAEVADAGAIQDCVRRAYARYVPLMGKEPGPMTVNYTEVLQQHEAHVATDKPGQVIGVLVLIRETDYLLLDNVAVDPAAQGGGVGRKLLALAEQRARALSYDCIQLYTHECMAENQELYLAIGYRESHRVTEHGYDRIYYKKMLR